MKTCHSELLTFEDFDTICSQYLGDITITPTLATFTRTNTLFKNIKNTSTSKTRKPVKAVCKIEFNGKSLSGSESSKNTIGGFGSIEPTKDFLIKMLEKYNFVKKDYKQLDIFEGDK